MRALIAAFFIAAVARASGQTTAAQPVGCVINIEALIDIYGDGATDAHARQMEKAIEGCWNGFKYRCCKVVFDVTVRAYPNASFSWQTGDGGWDVELEDDDIRSHVNWVTRGGEWRHNNWWTYCHEAGHIFYHGDDYSYLFGDPDPGHAGHMMAEDGGNPEQHEVDAIVENLGLSCPRACCPPTTSVATSTNTVVVSTSSTISELDAEDAFLGTP